MNVVDFEVCVKDEIADDRVGIGSETMANRLKGLKLT